MIASFFSRRPDRRSSAISSSRTPRLLLSCKCVLVVVVLLGVLTKPSTSQFGNIFEQFFQQEDADDRHSGHPGHSGQGSPDKFKIIRDQSRCSDYLCPSTFDCVSSPSDCPCPFVEDIKCPISLPTPTAKKFQDSFVCIRAPGCSSVQKALMFGS
ncbi:hypothetical protein PTTG_07655 [Puccinia triticina 1-1 BBBD Race 1]|uniref:Long chronological lifespan protein 2 n=2 Tax=Puccinia triticina TaxID=208348 RepID=A0A0C4F3H5_PUCT1|nr:uncharacterized protein PtA15_2A821 [Puccinia triticina]OAV92670.1 hypothetical protein PTTG_07655 [Puccinia triticina 1-1 BBBD Race 1]WAQ82504.1 hypothetical protein PtA15_2A821 [Puccinia triticina]WAR53356.1 hypothetical protein PtB15_2B787 [Puccinia triticina]